MPFFYNFPKKHDQPPPPQMSFPLSRREPKISGLPAPQDDPALKMLLAELKPEQPEFLDVATSEALEYLMDGYALHDWKPVSIGETGYLLICLTRGLQQEQPAVERHQRTMRRALRKGQKAADEYKEQAMERVAQVVAS